MLLGSGQVNKIWSELLPGCLIHFYSKWLGNFPEVGSAGSRVSSDFVCSCMSPSWLCLHRAGRTGSRGTSFQQDSMYQGLRGDIHLGMNQEGAWTGSMCLPSLPAACSVMNGTKGGFLVAALPAGWSRMARVAISLISIEKNQTVTLCPKSQASAVQLVRGSLALGHGSRGTAASCSSSLPSREEGKG